jgi:hypothetical protein
VQTVFPEAIDNISQALPRQNVYHDVGDVICDACVSVRRLNVGKRVRKLLSRRPGHGKHHVQWYSKLFGAMDVSKGWRISNDGVCYERLLQIFRQLVLDAHPLLHCLLQGVNAEPVSRLDTRSPCAAQNLRNAFPPFPNVAASQCVEARHETRILDHERHELSGIAANAEELKSILDNEVFEVRVCCETYSVAVCLLEHYAERNKWLHISSRSNYLYDDVQGWGRVLSWCASEKFWDIRGRWSGVFLDLSELALDLGENELREGARASFLVNADVDSSILCDYRVRAQPILVVELPREFCVGGRRLVGVRFFMRAELLICTIVEV